MQILNKICDDRYVPFCIGGEDAASGPRIGGCAPIGVIPSFRNGDTKYLMTIPCSGDLEMSLFYSFDFFNDGPMGFHDGAYILHSEKSPMVEMITHPVTTRGEDGSLQFMTGRELILQKALKRENESEIYEFHKFGGIPAFTREFEESLSKDISNALKDRFVHLVQLAFPVGPNDSLVDCNWPFGDAIFHLFVRQDHSGFRYKYCWG